MELSTKVRIGVQFADVFVSVVQVRWELNETSRGESQLEELSQHCCLFREVVSRIQ
jgi:hypothetical protein